MSADLGGRRVKVVSLAGHTRGSVGLLLEDEGLLLAGDGLNPTLLMLGPESATFAQLRTTLEAVEQLPFERYLASHAPRPIAKAQVGVHLRHLDQIRWEEPSHPGPYGPRVGRSLYKEKGGARSFCLTGACWSGNKRNIGPPAVQELHSRGSYVWGKISCRKRGRFQTRF